MSETVELKRGPGRPLRQEEVKKERRRRGILGPERNLKLYVPEAAKDPNYVYRFINDRPGSDRVAKLTQQDDYEIVHQHQLLGGYGSEAPAEGQPGTPVRRRVGSDGGQPIYAHLVRKPKEYYDADKKAEQALITDAENVVLSGKRQGSNELSPADNAYTPGERR